MLTRDMMRPPIDKTDPLIVKTKVNRAALWRTFDHVGRNALASVVLGKLTLEKAESHLQMLRKMILEESVDLPAIYQHLKINGLCSKDTDEIDFGYYNG